MTEPTKITTPLKEGSPFILEMGTEYSISLKNDERLTLQIINPNEAQVRCAVIEGAGEFSLYKNGRILKNTYYLSSEPGYPTTICLNTSVTLDNSEAGTIYSISSTVKKEEYNQENIKRNIAIQYSVPQNKITIENAKNPDENPDNPDEYKLTVIIPNSIWELYIAAGSYEDPDLNEHTFLVELLPPQKDDVVSEDL